MKPSTDAEQHHGHAREQREIDAGADGDEEHG